MYITTQIVQVGKLYSCKARQAAVCLSSSLLLLNKAASRSNKYSVLPCLLPSLFPSSSFFFSVLYRSSGLKFAGLGMLLVLMVKIREKPSNKWMFYCSEIMEIWKKKKINWSTFFQRREKKSHKGKLFCSPAVNTDSTSSQPHMTLS